MNYAVHDYCSVTPDFPALTAQVRAEYERLAAAPDDDFHFNRGLEYAVTRLGYDRALLESFPGESVERFAGLGNPHACGPIRPGEVVVDVGCGAGLDLLIAARRVGRLGRAIGVDPTPAMRRVAWRSATRANLAQQIRLVDGTADRLPLPDASADVVISNGVLNLSVNKPAALAEMHRVLKPGGRLYLADAVIEGSFKASELADPNLWAY